MTEAMMDPRGVLESQAIRLCQEIDERVGAFLDQSIEGERPSRPIGQPRTSAEPR